MEQIEKAKLVTGRITPRQVLEAYERTGMLPMQHSFYRPCAMYGGCAISAVVADSVYEDDDAFYEFAESTNDHGESWFCAIRLLDGTLTDDYLRWFTQGYDAGKEPNALVRSGFFARTEEGRKGYKDGLKASKAVFG